MDDFQLIVVVYVSLQSVSFALLPKWWKLAAVPALIAAPNIFFHGGYMGDVFATAWMGFACGYLVFVWIIVGVVRLIRRSLENRRKE
jgi:hypothetical protein